jgi:hypothetical protein
VIYLILVQFRGVTYDGSDRLNSEGKQHILLTIFRAAIALLLSV